MVAFSYNSKILVSPEDFDFGGMFRWSFVYMVDEGLDKDGVLG